MNLAVFVKSIHKSLQNYKKKINSVPKKLNLLPSIYNPIKCSYSLTAKYVKRSGLGFAKPTLCKHQMFEGLNIHAFARASRLDEVDMVSPCPICVNSIFSKFS